MNDEIFSLNVSKDPFMFQENPKKWEYKTLFLYELHTEDCHRSIDKTLNDLGKEGWELYSYEPARPHGSMDSTYKLKRFYYD